ncbi:MFS transporter [Sulfobacillus thermosulfidooxidans]|uniref:MFS transporter n=1 Tax=Sulfobacillus thermosulfidooxidans TaxID=28034 RepID=UPI0006B5B25B|nr:MFS transporter [Sulfobacillus thermosulfidooxidans]
MRLKPLKPSQILIIAFIDQLAITMSQQGLSILSEAFKNYAHLGVTQMGILFATVALGAVVGMIPAGLALDRYGVKTIAFVSGASILIIMLLLAALLPKTFVPLIVLLALVGFFLPALFLTGATAITKMYAGSPNEGMAIGLRQAATPLGGILAASLFPLLVKSWSLQLVLVLIALSAGGWTMLFGGVLKAPSKRAKQPARSAAHSMNVPQLKRQLIFLKNPLLVSFLLSPGQYALLTYAILDLHDRWHIHMTIAGPIIALALLGGFIARIYLGKLSDHGIAIPRLLMWTAALGLLSLILWALVPSVTPEWMLLFIFIGLGAGLDGWNALLTNWVAQITTEKERGMALGLIGMSGFIGIVLFLPLFGLMIRIFSSYRPAWLLLALIYFLGIGVIRQSVSKTVEIHP